MPNESRTAVERGRTGTRVPMRGDVYAPACPSRGVLDHVTSRWGVLILVRLLEGTYRFSELRRSVGGVSEKMLAQTLQNLEADGFVHREVHAEVPPRVEYSLTPLGREIAERVEGLVEWLEASMPRITSARARAQAAKAREAPAPRSRGRADS